MYAVPPSQSITRATLARMVAVAALVMTLGAAVVWYQSERERLASATRNLDRYAIAKAAEQERMFDAIERLHRDADPTLSANLLDGDDREVSRSLDVVLPLGADGRRWSRAGTSGLTSVSDQARGIEAVVERGELRTADERRLALAAYRTITTLGWGFRGAADNLTLLTPGNAVTIVAAPKPTGRTSDHARTLEFPPELRRIPRSGADGGRLGCTGLYTIRTASAPDRAIACYSLARAGGRVIGRWVSVIHVDRAIDTRTRFLFPGATILIASDDGRLLFRSGVGLERPPPRYAQMATAYAPQVRHIWDVARQRGEGVFRIEPDGDLVALRRLAKPGWWFIAHVPRELIRAAAAQTALSAVALGLAMLVVQALALRFVLKRQVVRPLAQLTRTAVQVSQRASGQRHEEPDIDLPVDRRDEVGEMARAFAAMAKRVAAEQRLLEAKVAERTAELERLATTDDLTGLANRRSFLAALEAELTRTLRTGEPAALVLFDVDHFKRINDGHGHAGGDVVLRTLAHRWRFGARDIDLCGRLGGEEFAILLVGVDEPSALAAAERMRHLAQAEPVLFEGEYIPVSLSGGVTALLADDTIKSVMARADVALYRAKAAGRDRVVLGRADNAALQALITAAAG